MANKNFSDFELRTQVLSSDFLVGYKVDGPSEVRINIDNLFNFSNLPRVAFNVGTARGDYGFSVNSSEVIGTMGFASNAASVSGIYSSALGSGRTDADYAFAQGFGSFADGDFSIAQGYLTLAKSNYSHADGFKSKAVHQYSYIWSDGILGTIFSGVSTTRAGQYRIDATGGSFFSGNVSINTDNTSNSLTVDGNLSATSIDVVGNLEADTIQIASNAIIGTNLTVPSINNTELTTTNVLVRQLSSTYFDGPSGSAVVYAPCTLSALNVDITYLTAKSHIPVVGTKTQTDLFLTIYIGTSTLYIPLFK